MLSAADGNEVNQLMTDIMRQMMVHPIDMLQARFEKRLHRNKTTEKIKKAKKTNYVTLGIARRHASK